MPNMGHSGLYGLKRNKDAAMDHPIEKCKLQEKFRFFGDEREAID